MKPKAFAIQCDNTVLPGGVEKVAILIKDGQISHIISPSDIPSGFEVENYGDRVLMPGLVDTHVHVNEPGRTEWEGFETATKAAAAGGITTLVDMPLNCSPVTTTPEAFQIKLKALDQKLWVDCGFYGGVVPGNSESLAPLAEMGVLGFKTFLIDSGLDEFPCTSEKDLRKAMPILTKLRRPLLAHAELCDDVKSEWKNKRSYQSYLESRPSRWEINAVNLMIQLCDEYRCHTHIVHLSSAEAVPAIVRSKARGLPLTVETCPHYLCFSSEEISEGLTEFKCAPPVRESGNREHLWEAVRAGHIDCIVSDHSPCLPALKLKNEGNFREAWGGIASLQFGLGSIWNEANYRGLSLLQLTKLMCEGPARLVGLDKQKGKIAVGYDADFVVWDPDQHYTPDYRQIFQRHPLSPYVGKRLRGRVERTFLRGKKIFELGLPSKRPMGQVLVRHA